jgi:hypothetical protein
VPVARPSQDWVVSTWVSVAGGVATGLFTAVVGALHLAGASLVVTAAFALAAGLATLVTIVAAVIWGRAGRRVAEQFGADSRRYVIQWGIRVWSLCLVVGLGVQFLGETRSAAGIGALMRSFGAAALIADVLITRARLNRLVAGLARPARAGWDPAVPAEIDGRGRPTE